MKASAKRESGFWELPLELVGGELLDRQELVKGKGPSCPHPDSKVCVPGLTVLKLCKKKLYRSRKSPSLPSSLSCLNSAL